MKIIDAFWNFFLFKYYNVIIGKNFRCDGRMIIQGRGEYSIGNNVGISHAILCAREKIIIEDNVLIGGGTKIYDNDFHSLEYLYRMQNPDRHIRKGQVKIKDGAFIGAHSIILKGVEIGEHSIVGAGSVVSCNIPNHEIWAGNPAEFIRKIE